MQAPRITYTICKGSVEEKEEEAWTSLWKSRNFRPLPGTFGPRNLRPSRNFRPRRIEAVQECANSLDSPDPARTFARNLRRPDLPADPGTSGPACAQTLGPKPMYLFAHLDYIYSFPFLFLCLAMV